MKNLVDFDRGLRGRQAQGAEEWVLRYVEREQGRIVALMAKKIARGEMNGGFVAEGALLVGLRSLLATLNADLKEV